MIRLYIKYYIIKYNRKIVFFYYSFRIKTELYSDIIIFGSEIFHKNPCYIKYFDYQSNTILES